jgi:hypothetical protein
MKNKKIHPWDFYNLTDKQREHALDIIMDSSIANAAINSSDPFICYLFDGRLQKKLFLWCENNCDIIITKLKDPDP